MIEIQNSNPEPQQQDSQVMEISAESEIVNQTGHF